MKPCRVCRTPSAEVHRVPGRLDSREYALHRCETCGYIFVGEPRTDYEQLYDEKYYAGAGSDPSIAYVHEQKHFVSTIHHYEWRSVLDILEHLGAKHDSPILDYGCGSGGLVRAARKKGYSRFYGFDEGWLFKNACKESYFLGKQKLTADSFDYVVAIEVFEHLIDPAEKLREIRELLKPGGKLFLTTGNAEKFKDKLSTWSYAHAPEVHIGFFEPRTLRRLFDSEGFDVLPPIPTKLYAGMFQYKILKVLGVKTKSFVHSLLPWKWIARFLNPKFGIADIPIGVTRDR